MADIHNENSSYGILCSDFKTSGLAAEEKENSKPNGAGKDEKGKGEEVDKGKGKGKGKDKDKDGEKPKKTKKKKPQGLFTIDWFRIGEPSLCLFRIWGGWYSLDG